MKYHFIGIGGIGMSGLAQILLDRGCEVSGSDLASTPITEMLKQKGAVIYPRQSETNIASGMHVVFSTDIKEDNPEYRAALQCSCPLWHRSQLLLYLMQDHRSLAVSGTHGKTTTSALLAWVLRAAGEDPSFSIGGIVPQFGSNGKQGSGKIFVAEADESDGSFLNYRPYGAIVTNIGRDHMNYFQEEATLLLSFQQFMENVENSNLLFWCGDDQRLTELNPPGVNYGFSPVCRLRCAHWRQEGWRSYSDFSFEGKTYQGVETSLIGKHNVLNAAAVFGVALRLDISEAQIRKGLRTFGGVFRRCEKKGEYNNALFIDDYAHHPTEIKATLEAIRTALPEKRLICIYQPHRFSRTSDCMGRFANTFDSTNQLIVTDIYSAGEQPMPNVSAAAVLKDIQAGNTVLSRYVPFDLLVPEIVNDLSSNDVFITLGAGSITNVGERVLETLKGNGR